MHHELGGPKGENLLYISNWAKIIGPNRLFLNTRGIYHGSRPLFYGTAKINGEDLKFELDYCQEKENCLQIEKDEKGVAYYAQYLKIENKIWALFMNGWLHCFDIEGDQCKHIERKYETRPPEIDYKRRKHWWYEYKENTYGLLTLQDGEIITYHFDDGEFIERDRLKDPANIALSNQATN